MVKRYTAADIQELAAFYEEHGVVRLKGFVQPDEVERILTVIDQTAQLAGQPQPAGRDMSMGQAPGRTTIRYMWRDIPTVRDFLLQPLMGETIARICGTQTLRLWFDLTFLHTGTAEGAVGTGTPWHHDIGAFTFKGELLPSLWMAMTPADAQRSRLEFIDGSHKTVPGLFRTPDTPAPADGSSDGFLDAPDYDALIAEGKEKLITWDCEPGDAIIIHPYVIHGARGNAGDVNGRRVAITTRWLGDDVRFLPTHWAKAEKAVGVKASGLSLTSRPRGEYFPLVYDATAQAVAEQGARVASPA